MAVSLMDVSNAMWSPVATDPRLWESGYLVPNFRTRSLAIELQPGRFVIYSPGAPTRDSFVAQFSGRGAPAFILVPNHYHHLGIRAWVQRFPEIQVVCSEAARPRLARLGFERLRPLTQLEPLLPPGVSLLEPPGTRSGEVWIRIKTDQTLWVVADAFFNYPRVSRRPAARLMQRLMNAAPGLRVSRLVKWVLVRDRSAYKTWVLERARVDRPTVLIPLHGGIEEDPALPERIRQVMQARF
jgi:glyoxylase-like metal-dependent hydrolase (beta-lactamase superfamily II)